MLAFGEHGSEPSYCDQINLLCKSNFFSQGKGKHNRISGICVFYLNI